MSLSMHKGMGYEAFRKAVKSLKLVILTQNWRGEAILPLEHYNVPIYSYQVKFDEGAN